MSKNKKKCDHKGQWKFASAGFLTGPSAVMMIACFYCKDCGKVKFEEKTFSLPTIPPQEVKSKITVPRMVIPKIMKKKGKAN